jgi:peptidoglycan hydrolase-like protein with peptidoglycan-binding domain
MMVIAALPLLLSPGSHHRAKLKRAGAAAWTAAATASQSDRLVVRGEPEDQTVTTQPSTPTPAPAHDAFPGEVRPGSTGPAVQAFQTQLVANGWQLAIDGIDGSTTTRTVQAFQAQKHLDVDGIGGPLTWTALLARDGNPPVAQVLPAPPAVQKTVPAPPPAPVVPAVTKTAAVVQSSSLGGVWACIRQHESGGNYATNTGNGYYGAYQFSLPTWRSLGGVGLPSDAPPAVQDAMAQKLQARSGWGQWPQTSKMCGV